MASLSKSDLVRARQVLDARRSLLEEFEAQQAARAAPDPLTGLRIADALLREALAVGALPLRDPLDGIELDVFVARALNVSRAP
jgi:hypothetical protein